VRQTTERQNLFLKLWQATGLDKTKAKECALRAGYSDGSSNGIVAQILSSPVVRSQILLEMERQGITVRKAVGVHKGLLNAKSVVHPTQPDHNARARGLSMFYQLVDAFPEKRVSIKEHSEKEFKISIDVIRRAEQVTGERILDAEVVEPEEMVYEPGTEPI